MAALTMSYDILACRYAAAVETNGYRVEMLTPSNIKSMLIPLFDRWVKSVGGGNGPAHIYYFRDGVSEGQFSHVLEQEVKGMKQALVDKYGAPAAGVSSSGITKSLANNILDQMDCYGVHKASSYPVLPKGR
jgi:eukaryotic translation initiation factor 2C